jgi:ABC-2 type transport system ATP-binding protein
MNDDTMVRLRDLEVRYGSVLAVRGVDLDIARGEVFGLLGPNGAGKTTTLSCIEGLVRPTRGSVHVAGYDAAREPARVKRLLGVQLQRSALFPQLRLGETVALYAALYDVYPSRSEVADLLAHVGLAQKAHALPGQLSGGQHQRLALALALVNDPRLVLLDEPTAGLDPQARRGVWALVERLRSEGRTVLLTTHYMEEAQELCDRVGIMDGGRLVGLGSPAALIRAHAAETEHSARRAPDLEGVFLALTGRALNAETPGV